MDIEYKNSTLNINLLYETVFSLIINYCKKFNKINKKENLIIHVKGGSSIKYHLIKRGIDTNLITNDFDLLLIKPNYMLDNYALNYFLNGLQQDLSSYIIKYEGLLDGINNFFKISLDDTFIIDLTIYQNNSFNDSVTNMFSYAAKKTGSSNTHDYVSRLVEYYNTNTENLNDEVIERITFTSLPFEYYSSIKGFELQTEYIIKYETGVWTRQLRKYQLKNNPIYDDTIASLQRQITPEYLSNLKDKKNRYSQKVSIINSIIDI